jgi:hypothetical protein
MSRARLGIAAWPENPAMNNPNETPSFGKEVIPMLVGWGSQILPGAVFLVKPSIKITVMSRTEDTIPNIDVMESQESGKNTAGKNTIKPKIA